VYDYITEDSELGRMWLEYLLALFSPFIGKSRSLRSLYYLCVCVCVAVLPILTL